MCGEIMKDEIRQKNKKIRAGMTAEEVLKKSSMAANAFLTSNFYKDAKQIMIYMRLGNETDTADIIRNAFADGKLLVFPVTELKTGIITPFYADEKTSFKKGSFSVFEPDGTKKADMTKTDVIIVPGIAFDKSGGRIGFGKGCYDRLLKNTDAIKIGYCYGFQICEHVPCKEHDVKMDFLITENGITDCRFSEN